MNIITNLLTAIESATGIEPVAFSSRNINDLPSVTYTAYRTRDNAVVEGWRFQTRVTAEHYAQAIAIEEAIADALVSLGDEQNLGSLRIQINGGGTLEDDQTGLPQLITYYDIQTKS